VAGLACWAKTSNNDCNTTFGGCVLALFATPPGYLRLAIPLVVAAWALLFPACAWSLSVAFINPGKSDEAYWVTVTQAM
jgi:hypothetical protein